MILKFATYKYISLLSIITLLFITIMLGLFGIFIFFNDMYYKFHKIINLAEK